MSVTHHKCPYLPARVVKAKQGWYILFYQTNPETKERLRHREKLGINFIPSKSQRLKHAKMLVKQINEKLPLGYPYHEYYMLKGLKATPVKDALQKALTVKQMAVKHKTKSTFRSKARIFLDYLRELGKDQDPVGRFKHQDAIQFMDHLVAVRKISETTYNGYKAKLYTLFDWLKEREYIEVNPFANIKKLKEGPKGRRAFNDLEKVIVADTIYRADKMLFLATVLQYYCFIRPGAELRRLKAWHFDLREGLISMPADITKNGKAAIVTIPDVILPYIEEMISPIPSNYFIFGHMIKPHPTIQCGINSLYDRHRKVLLRLKKQAKLEDITGLTFYSWKDTGAMELFKKKINILEIMKQLRHSDLRTTQRYCQSLYMVNREIKAQNNDSLSGIFL